MATQVQYAIILYIMRIVACVLMLAIGAYLYFVALSKIIKGSLFSINRNAQAKRANQSILLERIIEFLDLHSSVKQLSRNS